MKRILLFLLLPLTCWVFFELILHGAFHLYPRETHQKYLLKTSGGQILKKHNGAGALGDTYRGQPFKIAFLGMSELLGVDLPFFQRTSEQLKQLIGADKVHIDNFSVSFLDGKSILWQLESIAKKGRTYDIVVVSINGEDDPFAYLYHFARRWMASSSSAGLRNFFYRRREIELFFRLFPHPSLRTSLLKFFHLLPQEEERNDILFRLLDPDDDNGYDYPQNAQAFLEKAFRGEYFVEYIYQIRQYPQIKSKLVYRPVEQINIKLNHSSAHSIERIKKILEKISSHQYWVPTTVAYHPRQLPHYSGIYRIVYPTRDFDPAHPLFYNPKTVADIFAYKAKFYSSLAEKVGFKVLDYKRGIIEKMPYQEGLFLDEVHLSAQGSKLAAKVFAKEFVPLLRNEN